MSLGYVNSVSNQYHRVVVDPTRGGGGEGGCSSPPIPVQQWRHSWTPSIFCAMGRSLGGLVVEEG